MKTNHSNYRPDIDGLRAMAIVPVVVFHAFPDMLPGGFVGVDVFFVISGFLISSILFKSLARGDFSFLDFYQHRIKRIFPALTLVLTGSYLLGWLLLLPDEFMQLGKHIAAGAGFVQNIVLWKEAGYFDIDSQLKPLLHLWSLSVEEQFYLIYPLLIWAGWRVRHSTLMIVAVLGFVSFILNVHEVKLDAIKTFFVPHTRFWELMAGGALAYVNAFKGQRTSEWLQRSCFQWTLSSEPFGLRCQITISDLVSIAGLLLLSGAMYGLRQSDLFPGWWALLPVVGAMLLIFAGPDALVNRKFLGMRAMTFIGLISYPLYLWHWPLLSFAQILDAEMPSLFLRIAIVALSIILAWLTFHLVEKPIRFGSNRRSVTIILSLAIFLIGAIGYNAFRREGLEFRRVAKINSPAFYGSVNADKSHIIEGCGLPKPDDASRFAYCVSDNRGRARFALIGDSKAASLHTGVFMESSTKGRWLFIGGTSSKSGATVVPVISDAPIYAKYQPEARLAVQAVASNSDIDVVVITTATRALFQLANTYSIYDLSTSKNFEIASEGLDRAIAELVKVGKKVVLTVDNPTFKDPKLCIPRTTGYATIDQMLGLPKTEMPVCSIDYEKHLELTKQYRRLLEQLQAKFHGKLRIFDTLDLLCDMKQRVCSSMMDGKSLYSYSDHISEYASVRIGEKLVPFVEDFAAGN